MVRKNLKSEAEKFVKVENWGEQLSKVALFALIKPRWVKGNHKLAAVQFSLQPSP